MTIDCVVEYQRAIADIETCWGRNAATSAGWYNEMMNDGDEGGGPNSNHQSYENNAYLTGLGWFDFNRPLNSVCANTGTSHWHCQNSGVLANKFYAWDDRFP